MRAAVTLMAIASARAHLSMIAAVDADAVPAFNAALTGATMDSPMASGDQAGTDGNHWRRRRLR